LVCAFSVERARGAGGGVVGFGVEWDAARGGKCRLPGPWVAVSLILQKKSHGTWVFSWMEFSPQPESPPPKNKFYTQAGGKQI
jgi:hypothetical protein